jgi:hypothetical protein
VKINGETHYPWRAVDHEGEVLESYVTKTRDKISALKFLKKAMKRYRRPEEVVTDKLRSYRAAMNEIGNGARQLTRPAREQPGRKLAPPFSKTGTGDDPVPEDAKSAEIRRRPRLKSTTPSITIDPSNAELASKTSATRRSPSGVIC